MVRRQDRPIRRTSRRHTLVLAAGVLLLTGIYWWKISVGVLSGEGLDRRGAFEQEHQQTTRQQHNWLLFFSGHQGSSAVVDMLGQLPEVFVPGFEPLDAPGLTPQQKLAFLGAAFTLPASEAQFQRWRQELLPGPSIRVNRTQIKQWGQLKGKSVSGFKLRPYVLERDDGSHQGHTALTGLDQEAFKALLHKHNVSVLVTLRLNRVKEALSWYKARELGIKQFQAARQQRKGGRSGPLAVAGEELPPPLAGASSEDTVQAGGGQGDSRGRGRGRGVASVSTPGAVAVNITKLLSYLNYTERVNQQLRFAVEHCQRPTLTLYYEDFLADPLGTVGRAAKFIGADPSDLRLSGKFTKAGRDSLRESVLDFEELCLALENTTYFPFLEVDSCKGTGPHAEPTLLTQPVTNAKVAGNRASQPLPAAVAAQSVIKSGAAANGSSGPPRKKAAAAAARGSNAIPGKKGTSTAEEAESAMKGHARPGGLLPNWCAPADKRATGWEALSDEECMQRALAAKAEAVRKVQDGRGTLLFKHVHKAGGSTLCKLAQRNMVAETATLPHREDWDTNCVPYEAFLGPHPAVGLLKRSAVAGAKAGAGAAQGQQQQQQQLPLQQQFVLAGAGAGAGAAATAAENTGGKQVEVQVNARVERREDTNRERGAGSLGGSKTFLTNAQRRSRSLQRAAAECDGEGGPSNGGAVCGSDTATAAHGVHVEGQSAHKPAGGMPRGLRELVQDQSVDGSVGSISAGALASKVPAGSVPRSLREPLEHQSSDGSVSASAFSSIGSSAGSARRLQAHWLGGACWFGFLTPHQLRVLPTHFRPLTFLATEGPMPDLMPLDLPFAMVTMLRHPLDRVLSSYRWWQLMTQRMPASPAECRAYAAPANATLAQWLEAYPDNWMTRELVGASALYTSASSGGRLPQLSRSHLLLAKQRLHYFAAVLILEHREESARAMQEVFGWSEVDFTTHRAGSAWNSAAEREMPARELRVLRARNALDMELYEYALELAAAPALASAFPELRDY